jgi:histone acetyltransferase
MECYIHPGVDFLNISTVLHSLLLPSHLPHDSLQMIAYQRAFIYYQAMRSRQSHVVYPGMEIFKAGNRLQSPHEIPGVLEGGWQNLSLVTPRGIADRDRSHSVSKLNASLKALYDRVKSHEHAWPFYEPVTEDQVLPSLP